MTDDKQLPQRKPMRLKEFNYSTPDYVYFLTICARHLTNPFNNGDLAQEITNSLLHFKEKNKIPIYCYCLMPDHLHLVLSPSQDKSTSQIIKRFKSYTTQLAWKHGISGSLWQRSFYDHIARKDEDLLKICEYILANPVRKGLVENPDDWKCSGLLDPLPL